MASVETKTTKTNGNYMRASKRNILLPRVNQRHFANRARYMRALKFLARIRWESRAELQAINDAADLILGVSGRPTQDYQNTAENLEKYNRQFSIASGRPDSDLARENDVFQTARLLGSGRAEKEFQPILA